MWIAMVKLQGHCSTDHSRLLMLPERNNLAKLWAFMLIPCSPQFPRKVLERWQHWKSLDWGLVPKLFWRHWNHPMEDEFGEGLWLPNYYSTAAKKGCIFLQTWPSPLKRASVNSSPRRVGRKDFHEIVAMEEPKLKVDIWYNLSVALWWPPSANNWGEHERREKKWFSVGQKFESVQGCHIIGQSMDNSTALFS